VQAWSRRRISLSDTAPRYLSDDVGVSSATALLEADPHRPCQLTPGIVRIRWSGLTAGIED
jgi:hypothetical protein